MGFAKVGLKNMFWAMGNSIELLYIGRIKRKDTAKAKQEGFYCPTFAKPCPLAATKYKPN